MDLTKKIIPAVILLLAFVFSACKNDLKLNAPYKEFPSIYAVLNPQEQIQMIRINKVFLGEGDANQMARVSDSINYKPGELTVSLKHVTGGTIVFRDSVVRANDGAFNPEQRVYVSSEKLRVSGEYVLTVKNNNTGNVFTAKATSIDSISGRQNSQPFTPQYYPYAIGTSPQSLDYVDYSLQNTTKSIAFSPIVTSNPAKDPKVYQVIVRFHFLEFYNDGNTIARYVDYATTNQEPKDARMVGSFKQMVTEFKGKDIFGALGIAFSRMNLNVGSDVRGRKMYKVQFFAYASTQEYLDYLQFSAPSLNISQSKPLYSNFDNRAAIGIFTFRSRCSVMKEMSTTFINEFSNNSNTCQYKFLTVNDIYRGCQ